MRGRDCRFRFFCPHAERVELVAEVLPRPMCMSGDGKGWWEVRVSLPERDCRYKFLVDGRYCVPDYSAGDPVYDETGQLVSLLHLGEGVPSPGSAARASRGDRRPPGG